MDRRTPWGNPGYMRETPFRSTSSGKEAGPPAPPDQIADSHHYAYVSEGTIAVPNYNAVPPEQSIKIIDQPTGRRNLLGFRNNSTGTQNVLISLGQGATANSMLRLTPNQAIIFDAVVPQDDVWITSDAASASLSYIYSTILG